jgi:hypothetical protein
MTQSYPPPYGEPEYEQAPGGQPYAYPPQEPPYPAHHQQYSAQYQPYPPQPYGYPPNPYGYPHAPPQPTNGLGVAGFVLGLLGLLFFWFPPLGIVLSLLGVILGGSGMSAARRNHSSSGLAIAGLVCGLIGLLLAIIILAAVYST